MKMSEIKDETPIELQTKGRELRKELFSLNLQKSIGTLEKSHRIRQVRKNIARVETVLNSRKMAAQDSSAVEAEISTKTPEADSVS